MGISRDKWHKRRQTGGKRHPIRSRRRFELGRQPASTKLGERRVHQIRCHGGFIKFRALRLDHGNYAWSGEAVTRKCRIIGVVYNPTNGEFVRTNTLVKGSVIQIDATPFKNWYQKHYGVVVGRPVDAKEKKKGAKKTGEKKGEKKSVLKKSGVTEKKEKKEKKNKKEKKETKGKDEKEKEKKPTEKKPTEKKPTEKKPTEKKTTEKKPTEKKPTEKKPTEKKPTKKKPTDKKSTKKPNTKGKPKETTVAKTTEGKPTEGEKPATEGKKKKKFTKPLSIIQVVLW